MNFRNLFQFIKNMGFRYIKYRIIHEIEKKTGKLKKRHPINPESKFFIKLEDWKADSNSFVIGSLESLQFEANYSKFTHISATKILNSQICYFNHEWKSVGKDYDWITNPSNGFKYDINKHWSEIADLSEKAGDIKYVWEKSRFTYLLTIIRNDFHNKENHAEFVFQEIESWINHNPINQGPNWRCSQEISLRIINWCYVLHFYKNSKSLTEERWKKIQNVIYWSLHHVYNHIDFSRIAVRNNHAITETLVLTLSEMLFPFIPETRIWSKKGRVWFEEEIDYQIYKDGTFLQFSMNYHRVVIQLLSLGISISELNNKPLSKNIYDRAYKSLDFLYQCLQEENGFLPNYGFNDGALFFPLSDTNYRDYRPQINTLHKLITGFHLYQEKEILEDSNWILFKTKESKFNFNKLQKINGCISFDVGGYYLLREKSCFTFIRCGNHKDRPAHADNLHIDVWVNGVNILRDSGSFKYNTDKNLVNFFTGTASHNTVMIGENSQMLKGSRFIWYYWSQSKGAKWIEKDGEFIFEGSISAFRFLNRNGIHKRVVSKKKNSLTWHIIDEVLNFDKRPKFQIWHCDDSDIIISSLEKNKKLNYTNNISYFSHYYGIKKEGKSKVFEFQDIIETTIKYNNEN